MPKQDTSGQWAEDTNEQLRKTDWTIERVKDELPDVKVYIEKQRKTVVCALRGRKLEYAVVFGPDGGRWEYSWNQIVNALANDRPLIA